MKKQRINWKKESARAISLMLALCLLIGLAPITQFSAAAAAPSAISAVLKANFVEKGSTTKLSITGDGSEITGADVTYMSADASVATVDSSGVVTGVKIGKTTITVTADYGADGTKTTTIEIPVVGENLMTRQGVKHGEFKNDVYLNGQPGGAANTDAFWINYGYGSGGYYADQSFSLITDRVSHLTGESTNIAKFTFPQLTSEQEADPNLTIRQLRLDQTGYLYNGNAGDHSGQIAMDKNKLYECTGWIKDENTGILATDIGAWLFLSQTWDVPNNDGNGTTNKYYALTNNAFSTKPWSSASKNQDWTFFNLPPVAIDGLCTAMGYNELGGNIRLVSNQKDKNGDLLASHFSFHEVVYDKMVFTSASPLFNIDSYVAVYPGATIATTVKNFSNTGNEIISAKSVVDGTSYPIVTCYASSNPTVATINSSGAITINSGKGVAIISATTTIGGITKTQNLTISTSNKPSGEKYTYSFITKNNTTWPSQDVRNIKFAHTYDNWEYYGVGNNDNLDWANDGVTDTTDVNMYATGASDDRLSVTLLYKSGDPSRRFAAFRIHVPKAGTYKTSVGFYDSSTTLSKIRAYLLPVMPLNEIPLILSIASTPKLGSAILGEISKSATPTNKEVTASLNNVIIPEAGDYLFVIKHLTGTGASLSAQIRNLVLDGTTGLPAVLSSATLSLTDNELYAGETAAASVTNGLMSDNTEADLTGSTKTYFSSNPAVATVDSSTGVVTAVSAGTAQIFANVKLASGSETVVSESKTVTVLAVPVFSRVTLGVTNLVLDVNGTTSVSVTGAYKDDGSALDPASATSIIYTSDNVAVATVGETDGAITAISAGAANITATVTIGSVAVTGTASVIVRDTSELSDSDICAAYDFTKAYAKLGYGYDTRNIGYSDIDDTWAYASYDSSITDYVTPRNDGSGRNFYKIQTRDYGIQMQTEAGQWLALKVKVPAPGQYGLSLKKKLTSDGGYGKVYFMPVVTSPAAFIDGTHDTDFLVGTTDFYSASNKDETSTIGTVKAPAAGEYLVVLKASGVSGGSKDNITPSAIILDGTKSETVDPVITKSLTINLAGTGSITYNGNAFTSGNTETPAIGSAVTLAAAGEGFRYWKNATSGHILSTNASYEFKIGSNTTIVAVYSQTETGKYWVEFKDKNGKILQESFVAAGTTATAPAATPYAVGYVFSGWSPDVAAAINADTTFNAQYTKDTENKYNVEVIGGTIQGGGTTGSYEYNTQVTVVADAAPSGQVFQYWTRDGKITSYDSTYSFYVWDGTTVAAHFAPGAARVKVPKVMMDTVKTPGGGRIIFMSERAVPAGYELVETGILISRNQTINLGSYEFKGVAKTANAQFTLRKDSTSGTWYARAYLTCKETSTGKITTVYSNVVSGLVQ